MKKNSLIIGLLLLIGVAIAGAITVNPASSVTADSAATGLTIPYRDSNGDFAASTLTLAALVVNGQIDTLSRTVAQAQVLAPIAAGAVIYCSNCSPAKILVGTGTAAGEWADAVGGDFE